MKNQYDFRKGKRGAVLPAALGRARITIAIDKDILDWFQEQVRLSGGGDYQTLINLVLRDYIKSQREVLKRASLEARAYERARRRAMRDLRKPRGLGTGGKITWTRDELHERHPKKKAK